MVSVKTERTQYKTGRNCGLPVILLKIGTKTFSALLDSGASISLCSYKAFQGISPHLVQSATVDPAVKITTVTGDDVQIHSSVLLPIQISNKFIRHNFLIARTNFGNDYDLILGFDFLTRFQCNINFRNRMISFRGGSIKICKYLNHKVNVLYRENYGKLVRKAKLEPLASTIVKVKFSRHIPTGSDVLVNPLHSKHNVEIHRSVCTVNTDGTVPLIIRNLSQNTLHLNKNMTIAHIDSNIDVQSNQSVQRLRRKEFKISDFDLSGIPPDAKQKLSRLIFSYSDIFSTSLKTIGKCTLEAPPIEITDSTPIQCRSYPVPVALRDTLKHQIQELADADIIEKSNSRYSFPLILVKKKSEGQYRLVIDYRKLNEITVSSTYKLPLISDILNSLRGANFYCTLDANSSFHQIKLRDEDKHLTAFSSPYGNFQYKYLSFGMKNSPQIFQEMADTVLNGLQSENVSAYIDDIIIPAKTIDDSLRKLKLVFDRFRQYGLTLNPKKCRFLQTSIQYLGHVVDKHGLKPLNENLSSIQHFPVPNTLRKLRRFLGLANYYRDFVPNFSEIVVPLTELTKKGTKFRWTNDAQVAFEQIKSKLLSDVMLKHPNFDEIFYLNTDASVNAVGAALLQKDENGTLRPISYFSYKLKPHEKKWPAIQLEAYAILLAIRHYKVYLYGRKFVILSDCKSLNYLVKLDSPASRLSRWLLELSNYDFQFQHIKGSQNFLGDLLSRDSVQSVNVVKADIPDLETIKQEQRKDPSLKQIIDFLEYKTPSCSIRANNYFIDNGLLKRVLLRNNRSAREDYFEQIVVPKKLIPYILEGSETVHFAFFKNYQSIREKYFWKNMYRDIKNFSNSCKLCIERKGFPITKSPIKNFIPPSNPMELISLDVLGPLPMSEQGNKYVLTVIDHFSKYSILFALKDITAHTVATNLMKVVVTFGVPNAILTDLGTNFQSKLFTELAKKLQIHKLKTTPYRPQTNAVSERINTSIKSSLTCLSETTTDWDTYLDYYNFIYNNSYHDTIHEKPSFLMFNRDLNLPFHLLDNQQSFHYFPCDNYIEENLAKMQYVYRNVYKNLEIAADKQSRLRDQIAKPKSFRLGQKIYLYTPAATQTSGRAFAKKFSGPYRVLEKHSDLNYSVKDMSKPHSKPVRVHVDRMFAYEERRLDLRIPNEVSTEQASQSVNPSNSSFHSQNDLVPNYLPCNSDSEIDDYIPVALPPRMSNESIPKSSGPRQNISDHSTPNTSTPPTQNLGLSPTVTNPDNVASTSQDPQPDKQNAEPERRYNLRPRREVPPRANTSERASNSRNSSFADRILNWAMDSNTPQLEKNIIDKVADVLANKLAADLQSPSHDTVNNFNTNSL